MDVFQAECAAAWWVSCRIAVAQPNPKSRRTIPYRVAFPLRFEPYAQHLSLTILFSQPFPHSCVKMFIEQE